ncbi:NAD(P)/FAD-dependent oxidoreductase [Pseudonocardia sp. TRM90224]|uniref:NAD(P)/FAD-dependent oxidoreductase n=1 Tax=Pseudonocardia sp. TRM90224 TaxID=2812678 RepID=UPI001E4F34DE|nr:FAD-dependent oxidoreductase [Pseudonocardia sp. TRM90224]
MRVIVVGAGIAGVACARRLADAGVDVVVLERDLVVGGRMASPRIGGRRVDTGAAYFTVRDEGFADVVSEWEAAGLARPWTAELAVLEGGSRSPERGPMRWAAPGGLASLVAALADGLDVRFGHDVRAAGPGHVDGERAHTVVLAMPDPQAERLVEPGTPAASVLAGRGWRPVITVVAGFAQREWPELAAAFVNGHPVLSLVADDGARRGDDAPVLVAHTTAGLATAHAADPAGVVPAVLDALRDLLGVRTSPEWVDVRHWPHAAPDGTREEPFHLGRDGVALAGDGWGSPRIETAWRSGTGLADAMIAGRST